MNKDLKIIEIVSFDNFISAEFARQLIENNEIPCFLTNKYYASLGIFNASVTGGIKLFAFSQDFPQIKNVLSSDMMIGNEWRDFIWNDFSQLD